MDYEKMKRTTLLALADPKVGDLYHEWWSWWMVVEEVTAIDVVFRISEHVEGVRNKLRMGEKTQALSREAFRVNWCFKHSPELKDHPYILLSERGTGERRVFT